MVKKTKIAIELTDEQIKSAEKRAENEGRSRKNLLEQIVIEELKKLPWDK